MVYCVVEFLVSNVLDSLLDFIFNRLYSNKLKQFPPPLYFENLSTSNTFLLHCRWLDLRRFY